MHSANGKTIFPPEVGIILGPVLVIVAACIVANRKAVNGWLEQWYESHLPEFLDNARERNENYKFFLFDMLWIMLFACGSLLTVSAILHLG